jgi:hypothetical protein
LAFRERTTAPRIAAKSPKSRNSVAALPPSTWPATTNKTMHDVSFARPGDTGRKHFPWRSVSNRAQPRLGLLPVDDEA